MTIYVTRHGESMTNIDTDVAMRERGEKFELNVRNNILTRKGIQQALTYGEWLHQEGAIVSNIVCSPFARTKQTAYSIASALGTLPNIHYNRQFREIAWDIGGKFDRIENYDPTFDSKNLPIGHRPIVDTKRKAWTLESQLDVYNRAVPEFIKICKRYGDQPGDLVIVTHFFVVRAIWAFMNGGTPDGMLKIVPRNLCKHAYTYEDVQRATLLSEVLKG